MKDAYLLASAANSFDKNAKNKDAINEYRNLFGEEFPAYG